MKSEYEYAKDFFTMAFPAKVEGYEDRVLKLIRSIQRDAIRAAAEKCLNVVNYQMMDNGGVQGRVKRVEELHQEILSLLPEE